MEKESIEHCLVIPRAKLFGDNDQYAFSGFRFTEQWEVDLEEVAKYHACYVPRWRKEEYCGAEKDTSLKQIIPSGIFLYEDSLFTSRRLSGSSEQRLHGRQEIIIAGHINPEDSCTRIDKTLEKAMKREFHEEVEYNDHYRLQQVGYVNQDKNELCLVHFGIVYVLEGSSPNISIKETESHEGHLIPIKKLGDLALKEWQKYIADAMQKHPSRFNLPAPLL